MYGIHAIHMGQAHLVYWDQMIKDFLYGWKETRLAQNQLVKICVSARCFLIRPTMSE